MQGLHKMLGRSLPANSIGGVASRRRMGGIAVGGIASAWLLLTSSPLFAAVTTVDLSPLIYQSALVAPLEDSQQISVLLAVPSAHPADLAAFVKHVSSPGDPLYHQYLTPQQFADRFGGSEPDYTALKNWAAANGLFVSQESVGRINLTLRGNVSQIQKIFQTKLNTYRTPSGETFYSASVKPTVPAEISAKISSLVGLTESRQLTPLVKVAKTLGEDPQVRSDLMRPDSGGTGPGGTYNAKDLRTVYSIPDYGKYSQNTVMAVFEQGFYNPKDTEKYFSTNGLPNVKQTPISVNKSPVVNEPGVEVEACLDVDMIVGTNPNVSEVLVYVDDYHYDSFQVAIVDAITQVANDAKARILSISYGQDEGLQGKATLDSENTALQQCATEGITVFASSGDNGAYGNGSSFPYNVSDPSSQPLVTGVGGTTLFTGPGQLWENENAWDELNNNVGATGGGVSSYWPLPDWQNTTVGGTAYVTANGGSATYRNVPDVAAVGDPLTGVAVYVKDQGGWIQIGGTSVSSPIWAGYLSTINAAFSHFNLGNIGFFNPVFYAVGSVDFGMGIPYAYCRDIIQGQNGLIGSPNPGYFNGLGYSNTTGSGTIWGQGLAAQLMIGQHQAGAPPGAMYGFKVKINGTAAEFSWTRSQGASGYVVGVYHRDIFGNPLPTTYLTKTNKLTVNLPPIPVDPYGDHYFTFLWSFNASGEYEVPTIVKFNTK
jgi:subtilase family serine protease